jgi:hypothetical protein
MSQKFAINGCINVERFRHREIIAMVKYLEDIWMDVDNGTDPLTDGKIAFHGNSELCDEDHTTFDLQAFASEYKVNFKAMIKQSGEGFEPHYFGENKANLHTLKIEHAVEVSTAAFKSVGIDNSWTQEMLSVIAQQPHFVRFL